MSFLSWKGCALRAQSLLKSTVLDAALQPEAAALDEAIASLLAQEAGPAAASGVVVLTYGSNEKGALGQGFQKPPGWEPAREIRFPPEVEIRHAVAGQATSGYVTKSGQLFLSGSNHAGVHGDGDPKGRDVPTPVGVLAGRRVTQAFMAGASQHVLAFVDGRLHAWGRNPMCLGLGKQSQVIVPEPVQGLGSRRWEEGVPADEIAQVAVGPSHSLVITQDGKVFMSGSNARGQLGYGAPRNPYRAFTFEPAEGVEGVSFVRGACGLAHSALITDSGRLYTCGQNEHGQLGLAGTEDRFRPTLVSGGSIAGRLVVQVACGATTTLCVTDDGRLHGAGGNEKGELGLGDSPGARELCELELPGQRTVQRVCAGNHFALVLCTDGTLVGWGENTAGQVTPGEKTGRPLRQPVIIEHFAGKKIVDIATGAAHTVVMVDGG